MVPVVWFSSQVFQNTHLNDKMRTFWSVLTTWKMCLRVKTWLGSGLGLGFGLVVMVRVRVRGWESIMLVRVFTKIKQVCVCV